ncbi:MAG: AAA family ATPase [Acidobacteria bacterium]|nr:AAA family ATPase [Acidobacteriota bacterium]
MHLATLTIENFRCFGSPGITFEFRAGTNVVIGENNTGKTALIDALRILFSLGSGRRDVYVSQADFHCGATTVPATEVRLDAVFEGLSEDEQGAFYELLSAHDVPRAELHVRFISEQVKGRTRIHPMVWGGELEGQSVSGSTHELISHIYLGALRDAESDLRPGRGSRLGQLIRHVIDSEADRERILGHARTANESILKEKGVQRAAETINEHLVDLTGRSLRQTIRVGFLPPVFDRLAEALRPLLPHGGGTSFLAVYDQAGFANVREAAAEHAGVLDRVARPEGSSIVLDLGRLTRNERELLGDAVVEDLTNHVRGGFGVEQNGMGFNNLIYMGVVLGDLVELRRADPLTFNALLIEEPEAHLHPQLQVLVYDFLDRTSVVDNEMGQVQVFVTSHSPTLTSRADLDSVVVIHRSADASLAATAIRRCPLSAVEKQDLKRYLDVTRSQLFFARGVLLVEGISEALVVPALALRLGRRIDHGAVEVVNVSGVSFAPFAKLFNSSNPKERLDIPCAIITDDDRCSEKTDANRVSVDDDIQESVRKLKAGLPSARCMKTLTLKGGQVGVHVARKTLECELGFDGMNVASLVEAVRGSGHPVIASRLEKSCQVAMDDWERAATVWWALADVKAEVSQRLASLLAENEGSIGARPFRVPSYIDEALKHVMPTDEALTEGTDATAVAEPGTV